MTFEQQSLLGSDQDFSAIMNAARHTMPRLLVIDDDNLHRMIICRVAAKAGFLPAGAASYDEAVKLASMIPASTVELRQLAGLSGL